MALKARIEPFADNATIGCSLAHPEMLPAARPVCFRKITPIALASPHPPAPRRPAGLPSATSQDRDRRLRPDTECAALVDVGAFGGDAGDISSAVRMGANLAATLSRGSAMKVRHAVDSGPFRSDEPTAG
jgi:hypothetical protein